MTDPRLRFLTGVDDRDVDDVVRLLDDPTVRVTCSDPTAWRHQVLLYALVDLLGRIFPRLDIAIDDAAAADRLPPGAATVNERISSIRQRSPLQPLPAGDPSITVHVGGGDAPADLYVDASEWQSYLGCRPSRLRPPRIDSAVGPLVAACRAGARVHAELLASLNQPLGTAAEVYSSALTHRSSPDPIEDPEPEAPGPLDALVVGAGSVGGAAAYTFAYEPDLRGRLTAVDPQHLDDTNPFRAILATAASAAARARKADEVAAALAHHNVLLVNPQSRTITEWEALQEASQALPLTLVAVDTRDSRELIQDALPLEVVNAAVGPDLVAVSGHRTGSGPCMCCLHMPEVLDATAIKNRLIANATGLRQPHVNELRVRRTELDPTLLRAVERHRELQPGALDHYAGSTLDELYNAELLYGETKVTTASGATVAVASPFVTALAGVLLAAEALKRSTPGLTRHALGPDGPAVQYRENPYVPEHAILDAFVQRSPICLCRSVRRLRLIAELHQLNFGDLTT